jgi:hypothetical protein
MDCYRLRNFTGNILGRRIQGVDKSPSPDWPPNLLPGNRIYNRRYCRYQRDCDFSCSSIYLYNQADKSLIENGVQRHAVRQTFMFLGHSASMKSPYQVRVRRRPMDQLSRTTVRGCAFLRVDTEPRATSRHFILADRYESSIIVLKPQPSISTIKDFFVSLFVCYNLYCVC